MIVCLLYAWLCLCEWHVHRAAFRLLSVVMVDEVVMCRVCVCDFVGVGCGESRVFGVVVQKSASSRHGALPHRTTPDVGLEPTTLRLRVSCSTD